MVAAYIAGEPEAALKKLVKNKYDYQMLTYEEVVGDRPVSEVPVSETAPYCAADAYFSLRYHNDLVASASPNQLKVYLEIDVPAVAVVSKMELAGIKFDVDAAQKELYSCSMAIDTLTETIRERARASGFVLPATNKTCQDCHNGRKKRLTCNACGRIGKVVIPPEPLNPMANDQLKLWFHGSKKGFGYAVKPLGLPVQGLTPGGKPSLNALALLRLRQPPHNSVEAALVLSLRRQVKFRGYLVDWIVRAIKDKDSRIHSTFTTTVVSTGRFSSREPNLQQVKLGWRKLFIASPGKTLVVADYNQLEVRIAAHQSQDPALLAAMRAPVGTPESDLHGQNVERLFGIPIAEQGERKDLRVSAKTDLFAAMYGGREDTLKQRRELVALNNPDLNIPIPTFKDVARSLRILHRTYPRYFAEYAGFVVYKAREEGGFFRTAYGRERKLDDLFSAIKSEREAAEREGLNLTVQGTAADIIKIAMAEVDKIPHGRILLQVHDELVCEVDNDHVVEYTKALESAMEIGQPLTVPLIVVAKPASNWFEGHG
jgi:DNA polymerase-1